MLGNYGVVAIVRTVRLSHRGSQLISLCLVGCRQHFHVSYEFDLVGAIESMLGKYGVVAIVRTVRLSHRGSQLISVCSVGCR